MPATLVWRLETHDLSDLISRKLLSIQQGSSGFLPMFSGWSCGAWMAATPPGIPCRNFHFDLQGGFLSHGGTPKSSKSWVTIEYWNPQWLWDPHFKKPLISEREIPSWRRIYLRHGRKFIICERDQKSGSDLPHIEKSVWLCTNMYETICHQNTATSVERS